MKYRWCAVVLAGVLALGGCSSGAEPAASPEPSVPSAVETVPPSESPSPAPASPSASPTSTELLIFPDPPEDESPEVAEIREAWMAYERLMFRYYREPDFNDLNALHEVATGEELERATQLVLDWRKNRLLLKGFRSMRDVVINEPAVNDDGIRIATLQFCSDPTKATAVDYSSGEVILDPDQTLNVMMTMELLPDDIWRAAIYRGEVVPC